MLVNTTSEIADLQRQLRKWVCCYWGLHTPAFCAVAWQPSCHQHPGIAEQPAYAKKHIQSTLIIGRYSVFGTIKRPVMEKNYSK